jgi:hypothetical protein
MSPTEYFLSDMLLIRDHRPEGSHRAIPTYVAPSSRLVLVNTNQRIFWSFPRHQLSRVIALLVAGYSTSIAGFGNLSIRDTATMSIGKAKAAIQNEFQRAKDWNPSEIFDRSVR